MLYQIKNWLTGAVQFEAEIECEAETSDSVKLGLAIRVAVKARANLAGANLAGANLARANLAGADLAGAYLAGAYLAGADLAGANLAGADLARGYLAGAKVVGIVARATRSDGYEFIAYNTDRGLIIRAGCRTFSLAQFRAHVAENYPDTPKAVETTDILDFIERRASAMPIARTEGRANG